jgi:hypothetical protein
MKIVTILLCSLGVVTLAGCSPQDQDKTSSAEEVKVSNAGEEPEGETKVALPAPNENLMKITCADFLATANVAVADPESDAAKAAQDELANGLTWLHGYLYGAKNGKVEVLSQDWMKATAKRVFDSCSAAKDPKATSLFEVATS